MNLLIIDDPHKDREEAESPVYRKRVWTWYRSTAASRLEPNASQLVIMQRWREDDLVGQLLAHEEEMGIRWEFVNFPAIAEDEDVLGRVPGEALWPARYDERALDARRLVAGPYNWASQYQQRPAPAGGAIFKRSHFRYFRMTEGWYELLLDDELHRRYPIEDCMHFQTADTALETGDTSNWTVCTTFALTPAKELLVRRVARAKLEVPDQLPFLFAERARYPSLAWQGVERKASGHGLIQSARRAGKPFRVLEPGDRSKVLRATSAAVMYANGMVYHRRGASWIDAFEGELLVFPTGTDDDQVDTVSYAAEEAGRTPVQIFV